ncbi:MAG: FAD-dependent oxidoreductase [Winogradskyella sp.]
MKKVDYIIVGCGLASIAFCEQLRQHKKSFIVFDDRSQQSSLVAGGMYNPVILKRFSEVWKAKEQLDIAIPLYQSIEQELNIKVDYKFQLLRRFTSVEEQNLWFSASDKPNLEPFLSTKLIKNENSFIVAPLGFGEVLHAGRLDTITLISEYKKFLKSSESLREEHFVYDDLVTYNDSVTYKDIDSSYIVFAEGFGVKQNPFFRDIPLNGTKGEVLTIKAPALKVDYAVKSSVFIIPIGNDLYKVGATYNWEDKTNTPTNSGREELLTKLNTFLKCNYEVVDHVAGIRPTVKDRRPLVGAHSKFKNLFVLNGLGTRGVMIAPYVAERLFQFIEEKIALDKEIDVNRFNY